MLERVDLMSASARRIMAGDMNERLAVSGAGDELDRLAENFNAMLERISELMSGLREVSDNIAHDLKTPLNRLRSRAEAALRELAEARAENARLRDGYEWDKKYYETAIGQQFVTALATAPEFMLR